MARLNTPKTTTRGATPLKTVAGARTHEGGVGFSNDAKSEVYRLGVNLLGNDSDAFYEKGKDRDKRFTDLVEGIATDDPTWLAGFLPWLRGPEANLRTAPIMGAAHMVGSRLKHGDSVADDELLSSLQHVGLNRYTVSKVLQRADEPGEFISYYENKFGKLPKAVKRALSDAANRLWANPYAVQKYDTVSKHYRFADVMNVCHIKPAPGNEGTFRWIMDRRYGNDTPFEALPKMVQENISLRKDVQNDPQAILNPSRLRAAGMTWEDALSLAGPKVDKGKLWSALILSGMVPIFATVRNLRNFDEAGITDQAKEYVHKQLTNPEVIAKSRMFPFRFLTALQELNSFTWHSDLETAVQLATSNVPALDGKTIVLVDTSASMDSHISGKSKLTRSGMAAFFGGAFASKNAGNVHLFIYADGLYEVPVKAGTSALKLADQMHKLTGHVGHGTQTGMAVQKSFAMYPDSRRVIINTDMQSFPHTSNKSYSSYNYYGHNAGESLRTLIDPKVHMYAFDLAGNATGDIQSGQYNRAHQLAGMTDSTFKWIPLVEKGYDAKWPWE